MSTDSKLSKDEIMWAIIAAKKGDLEELKERIRNNTELCQARYPFTGTVLHAAVNGNQIKVIEYLLDIGVDIDVDGNEVGTPLCVAASNGNIDVLEFLIAHGANPNAGCGTKPTPLDTAASGGQIESIKLLLAHGADINASYPWPVGDTTSGIRMNALSLASLYADQDTVKYLESQGAVLPVDPVPDGDNCSQEPNSNPVIETNNGEDDYDYEKELLAHIENSWGTCHSLALREIVPSPISFSIQVIPPDGNDCFALRPFVTLITTGLSQYSMPAAEAEKDAYIELMIKLPYDWPMDINAFSNSRNYWPIEWLRKIACFPFIDNILLKPELVISNEDPAKPFDSSTELSSFLLLQNPFELGEYKSKNGKEIKFIELFPLYDEEKEFHKIYGTAELLKRFDDLQIPLYVSPERYRAAVGISDKKRGVWFEELIDAPDDFIGNKTSISGYIMVDENNTCQMYWEPWDYRNGEDMMIIGNEELAKKLRDTVDHSKVLPLHRKALAMDSLVFFAEVERVTGVIDLTDRWECELWMRDVESIVFYTMHDGKRYEIKF